MNWLLFFYGSLIVAFDKLEKLTYYFLNTYFCIGYLLSYLLLLLFSEIYYLGNFAYYFWYYYLYLSLLTPLIEF
jgi:hypothetical protein